MPQATEQEKNLGSGEQNSQTSEQCLKQYKKITKQTSINKGLKWTQEKKKTKYKMDWKCQHLHRTAEATCGIYA